MNELAWVADSLRFTIRRTWWVLLFQGIAALILGILLFTSPGSTLVTLALFLGAYWLISGVIDIIGSFTRCRADRHWWLPLLAGIISAVAGLVLVGQPLAGAVAIPLVLALLIAAGAITSGIFNIVWAIAVRNEIQGEGWIILWGLISIVLGIWLLSQPLLSTLAFLWMAALLAVIGGIAIIIMSFRLRSLAA
ncbi:MAG TPA: DUF308 domain-containing protein [Terriglobia bacterium]|nr:DUF308 domain-containing protein [Terriglobia bacterium]